MFSDESSFCFSSDNRCIGMVRRSEGMPNPVPFVERSHHAATRHHVLWRIYVRFQVTSSPYLRHYACPTIHVWYVAACVTPLPSGVSNALYQTDNARSHALASVNVRFNVHIVFWPAYLWSLTYRIHSVCGLTPFADPATSACRRWTVANCWQRMASNSSGHHPKSNWLYA